MHARIEMLPLPFAPHPGGWRIVRGGLCLPPEHLFYDRKRIPSELSEQLLYGCAVGYVDD